MSATARDAMLPPEPDRRAEAEALLASGDINALLARLQTSGDKDDLLLAIMLSEHLVDVRIGLEQHIAAIREQTAAMGLTEEYISLGRAMEAASRRRPAPAAHQARHSRKARPAIGGTVLITVKRLGHHPAVAWLITSFRRHVTVTVVTGATLVCAGIAALTVALTQTPAVRHPHASAARGSAIPAIPMPARSTSAHIGKDHRKPHVREANPAPAVTSPTAAAAPSSTPRVSTPRGVIEVATTLIEARSGALTDLVVSASGSEVCWRASAAPALVLHADRGCLPDGQFMAIPFTVWGDGTITIEPGNVVVRVITGG